MKDLDFDELDRAVSSLMTGAGAPEKPDEKTLTITPTLGDNDVPQFPSLPSSGVPPQTPSYDDQSGSAADAMATPETMTTQVVTPAVTTTSSRAPLATRRGGRFMDMVRPSPTARPTPVASRVSREGITLSQTSSSPLSSPVVESTTPEVSEERTAPTPVGESEQTTSPTSWPDPIDFQNSQVANSANETVAPGVNEEPVATPPEESLAPLQSPFLTDTKVEKRPLGAFASPGTTSAAEEPTDLASEPSDGTASHNDLQTVQEPTPLALPDELSSDIVSIEADTGVSEEPVKTPVATVPSQSIAAAVALGSTSIKQQYHEAPSTTPADHAPIYETESYNQPLAHPAKKKSGWLVVLLIVLILILGAAGGAAIYFFVL